MLEPARPSTSPSINRHRGPASDATGPQKGSWLPLILSLLPAITYGLCVAIAFTRYPGSFTPVQNTLSELGSPILNPAGSPIYRLGCVLGGTTTAAFFLTVAAWRQSGTRLQNHLLAIVQALGILAALAMALFAVYPYNDDTSHLIVLGILANSTLALLLFSLVALYRRNEAQRLRMTVTIAAAAAILLMYSIPSHHWAEWIPAFLSQVNVWIIGFETSRPRQRR